MTCIDVKARKDIFVGIAKNAFYLTEAPNPLRLAHTLFAMIARQEPFQC